MRPMRVLRNRWPHVTSWEGGLWPITSSLDKMKQFAIEQGTWQEPSDQPVEEDMIPIHVSAPLPRPMCEDSRRFVEHLSEIADMKLNQHSTDAEIAQMFQI